MKIHAFAKINWSLDITGVRQDGYHLLDMLMQPVSLYDEITLLPADTITLSCSGSPLIPPDEHHLALRAAKALQAWSKTTQGAAIHVHKQIPAGAGMGGGSADAAGVLFGLNQLWGLNYSQEILEAIGLTLGADVPFCLRGGLQRTTGIGEEMTSPGRAPVFPLVVIQPCEGLSTAAVFKAYHKVHDPHRPDTPMVIRALTDSDPDLLALSTGNVLQAVSEQLRPEIADAIGRLKAAGAALAMMTGSGSAVFGVFKDAGLAGAAFDSLSGIYSRCHLCSTCEESVQKVQD